MLCRLSVVVAVVQVLSGQTECMIRQNLFPVGTIIRFSTAMWVTATSLSGDFFLRYRVTSSFFSLISSLEHHREVPLRSVRERQGEDKRNITRELGGHQGVQKFSIRLSRDGSRAQWENCIMSTQWMSSSMSSFLFFSLQHVQYTQVIFEKLLKISCYFFVSQS